MRTTKPPVIKRVPLRLYWGARALIQGRLFYEGGTSDSFPRGFVWDSIRPRPWWTFKWKVLMPLTKGHIEKKSCGCWSWFGRQQGTCLDCIGREWGLR